jgi:voltage-gated potassium channel
MTISSLGGIPDDASPSVPAPPINKRDLLVVALQTLLRLVVGFVFIAWLMSLAPKSTEDSVVYPVVLAIGGIVLYGFFFQRQLKGVYKARFPTLRAVEALILMAAMFLAIFSMVYVMISLNNPGSFTEDLDSFSAYYFALTVLATVGFGDIAPTSVAARSVTMVQMALDIAFIAVLIRLMGNAARKALMLRGAGQGSDDATGTSSSP